MIKTLIELPRVYKQILIIFIDSVVLVSVLHLSFAMRLGYWFLPETDLFLTIYFSPFIAVPIFYYFGLYHDVIRFFGMQALWVAFKSVSLYALIWGLVAFMSAIEGIPRSVILINWLLAFISIGGLRLIARKLLGASFMGRNHKNTNIIIYGAGSAGRQLSDALSNTSEFRTVAFIDDSENLNKQIINGVKVHNFDEISVLIKKYNVNEIFLAIPSLSRKKRKIIIDSLQSYSLIVKILPSFIDIAKGNIGIDDLREVNINDLLGRETISPNQDLLETNIRNKVVMVTGAGGSIGSELSRQISLLGATKLLLFDHSEAALYKIDLELNEKIEIIPILGSILDQNRLEKICHKFCVQTIYHAAAYKHVPMVEFNNTEGVLNNIFGTLSAAKAAINANVETFVLISTDKAVRPTNTMGATKRCAEIILQSLSQNLNHNQTRFMMVRFGNVLDSSGSVIPLFKKQIKEGGPITVTDKRIVRYFMTISEAVELVIQSGAMGKGGDIFVLDMGEPIKIFDLAVKMIQLSGLEVIDKNNPNGDIEINFIGLRPGEKLYEELLIGGSVFDTEHSLIMRTIEETIDWDELKNILNDLKQASFEANHDKIREILIKMVPEFQPQSKIVDNLYLSS